MKAQPLVTVITGTINRPHLMRCVNSVFNQTYSNIQHIVMYDGVKPTFAMSKDLDSGKNIDVIHIPFSTGKDGFNAHRLYGGGTYFAEGQYVMYLDDDNAIKPTHIEDCVRTITEKNVRWTYSLRNIVDADHKFICEDNCESLGKWPSILSNKDHLDYFIDVNCYFLPRDIALAITPVWFRKFRQPGQMEIDRAIMHTLLTHFNSFDCTYKYTVDYAVGNTERSVKADFFLQGNPLMAGHYNGALPWKVRT